MVSVVGATLSIMLGVLVYIAGSMAVIVLPVQLRYKVMQFHLKLAARCLKQFTFVRRILSGYDIKPISVDDEQKLLKVTLSSSLTGDDNAYPFKDPAERIKRLFNKPVALAYEQIPAAVDAELAEHGYWVGEKAKNEGLYSGDPEDSPEDVTVDPYIEEDDRLRCVDPVDAFNLVPNAVNPENVKTTEQLTKKRFEKYSTGVGMVEVMTGAMGFAIGMGGIAALQYVQNNVITNGGGGDPQLPSSPLGMTHIAVDAVVMLV